jgi:hypothetical protein
MVGSWLMGSRSGTCSWMRYRAATVFVFDHMAGVDKVADHVMGAALGDADHGGDVPQPYAGVVGDAQQGPGVVGDEPPTSHAHTLP